MATPGSRNTGLSLSRRMNSPKPPVDLPHSKRRLCVGSLRGELLWDPTEP